MQSFRKKLIQPLKFTAKYQLIIKLISFLELLKGRKVTIVYCVGSELFQSRTTCTARATHIIYAPLHSSITAMVIQGSMQQLDYLLC